MAAERIDDEFFATDGCCAHEHDGRFNYKTGRAGDASVRVDLATYPGTRLRRIRPGTRHAPLARVGDRLAIDARQEQPS